MAAIPVRNFATLVGNFAAGVQGRARELIDFSTGSVLRAVAEATADAVLWLQSLIVYVLSITRAKTSRGADLDSWYADWNFYRLPAQAASGVVTFARFSSSAVVSIPVGALVQTGDASLIYAVTADPNQPSWSPANGGLYTMVPGVTSLDLPVVAVIPAGTKLASLWNVGSGQITEMRSTVAGIDTVVNAGPFTTGIDEESDPDFQARFPLYIGGLSKATQDAIRSAVANLRQGLSCTIVDTPGFVTVTVDDGTGTPSIDTVQAALTAVNAVRAGGVFVAVVGARRVVANVAMIVGIAPGYRGTTVVPAVADALGKAIDALGLGQPLRYTSLAAVAYGVPGVINVTGVTINNALVDLDPGPSGTVKPGPIVVSPGV